MRGKLHQRGEFQLLDRNIPAYAGKTMFDDVKKEHKEEHPRVCGENNLSAL